MLQLERPPPVARRQPGQRPALLLLTAKTQTDDIVNGLYFVESVTSTLSRGAFKQSFTLTRNGLISITPKVPA